MRIITPPMRRHGLAAAREYHRAAVVHSVRQLFPRDRVADALNWLLFLLAVGVVWATGVAIGKG